MATETKNGTKTTAVRSQARVPLHEAEAQMQMIENLLNQIELLATSDPGDPDGLAPEQIEQMQTHKQQQIAQILVDLLAEAQENFAQAINRMLNRAAFETGQVVGQEAIARYYRGQAATLAQEVSRSRNRVGRIKAAIAAALEMQEQRQFQTAQHKMHLSRSTRVVIDQETVPGLEGLIALNAKYPGLLRQLKFSESGLLIDVEFSQETLKRLLKSGDEEVEADLEFASLVTARHLVVPTISEAKMKEQVVLHEGKYGPELE